MRTRPTHVRWLSQRERSTLALLRGADETRRGIAETFAALADCARAAGYTICSEGALFVSQDERLLLAWLALLQRQRFSAIGHEETQLDAALLEKLTACANLLDEDGCRLRYDNVHFLAAEQSSRHVLGDVLGVSLNQARVVRFVAERGTVASQELSAMGVSRDTVRSMCRKRLLRRASHGLYVLGNEIQPAFSRGAEASLGADNSMRLS